ncbi:hypothetical protein BJ970_004662 [Saccharopolyspora phatthalungensis]|uniref:Uncharacterized protein n=1 Tax=Saccharopolyspora phatthalungensis TaxID=664693 RepID=A0A840QEL6_9PSEU|nr:hypothetical protein [Saccharopolyspora phatthalungensis]
MIDSSVRHLTNGEWTSATLTVDDDIPWHQTLKASGWET